MYDEIICNYKLPGNPPAYFTGPDHRFQTKSLDRSLSTYMISEDGRLYLKEGYGVEQSNGQLQPYTGTIEFYDSNIVGSGHGGRYTREGEDAVCVSYEATFLDGILVKIIDTENETLPAVKMKPYTYKKATADEIDKYNQRKAESLVGKTVYILWGSIDPDTEGYYAEVVAETTKEICVKHDDKLENLPRCHRDHIFWDSEKEAKEKRKEKHEQYDKERKEFEEYTENWKKTHEAKQKE